MEISSDNISSQQEQSQKQNNNEIQQKYMYIMQDDEFNLFYNEIRCSICLDIYQNPYTTNCSHTFCQNCIHNYLNMQGMKNKCPLCVKPISKQELRQDRKAAIFVQIYKKIEKEKLYQCPLNSQTKQIFDFDTAQKIRPFSQNNQEQIYITNNPVQKLSTQSENLNQQKNQFNQIQQQYNQISQTAKKNQEDGEKRFNEEIHILASNMTENFQEEIDKFCQIYPNAKQHKEFNKKITHLIVNPEIQTKYKIQAVRSVKYLQCVLKGIWVVSVRWIVNSNGYGYLQQERDHEITCDKKGKSAAKISRVMKGLDKLFDGMKFYVVEVGFKNIISKKDLHSLIELGGGEIILREQNYIQSMEKIQDEDEKQYFYVVIMPEDKKIQNKISPKKINKHAIILKHCWILDSISNAKVLNCTDYF